MEAKWKPNGRLLRQRGRGGSSDWALDGKYASNPDLNTFLWPDWRLVWSKARRVNKIRIWFSFLFIQACCLCLCLWLLLLLWLSLSVLPVAKQATCACRCCHWWCWCRSWCRSWRRDAIMRLVHQARASQQMLQVAHSSLAQCNKLRGESWAFRRELCGFSLSLSLSNSDEKQKQNCEPSRCYPMKICRIFRSSSVLKIGRLSTVYINIYSQF